MRKYIYLLKTTPSSHTHRFHPLPLATPTSCSPHPLATPIHTTHSPQLSSILLTLHKFKVWMTIVESGWNVWVWLVGVVLRRYIYFLILLIPTPLVSVLFCSSIYIQYIALTCRSGSRLANYAITFERNVFAKITFFKSFPCHAESFGTVGIKKSPVRSVQR